MATVPSNLRARSGSNQIVRKSSPYSLRRPGGTPSIFEVGAGAGPLAGAGAIGTGSFITPTYSRSVPGVVVPLSADPLSPRSLLGRALYGRKASGPVPINVVVNVQT